MAMKEGTKTITLRVPSDLYEGIINTAKDEDRSANNFISHVVKTYIENKKQNVKK